ncbi:MAG: sugar phosphate isomerase/epimerase family protein [Haloferacaceae archaeon]
MTAHSGSDHVAATETDGSDPAVGASYDVRYEESVAEFAAFLDGLGLSHVEIRAEALHAHPSPPTPRDLRELAESEGLTYTVHAPFRDVNPGSFNDDVRESAVEQTRRTLSDAAVAGAGAVVYHPGSVPARYPEYVREKARENALESLRELTAHAEAVGVPLCVENLRAKPGTVRHTSSVSEFEAFLDDAGVDSDYLGVTLDVGHAKVNGTDLGDFLDRFGDRVTVLHLHDNDGERDDHDPLPAYGEVVSRVAAPYNVLEMKSFEDVHRSVTGEPD